jgi:exodeoxyribonuclease VII large subunit
MSEKVNGRSVFSLLEVTRSIQKTINDRYKGSYWVKAEMNKLNFYKHSGHCYPELVEKVEGKVIAQLKSNIWKEDFIRINNKFQEVLKEPLKDGIKILFLASVSFDPIHGLALRIIDIDPGYTLGDLEREKQETITKLKDEGIFNKNKTVKLPLLPQRIAIISVETSKGYADFLKIIENNPWGYKFFHLLFPSLLQGDNAIDAIVGQLNKLKKVTNHFDVVAIIRGGGGDIGLSCYNSYTLAKEIALFPLPVVTGIGHATNETVAEMVSFSNAITPTKLAEYLLQKFHDFATPVQKAEEKIIDKSTRLISEEKQRFQSLVRLFQSVTENSLLKSRNDIKWQSQILSTQTTFRFKNENEYLVSLAGRMQKGVDILLNNTNEAIIQTTLTMRKAASSNISASKSGLNEKALQVVKSSRVLLRFGKEKIVQFKEKLTDKSLLALKTEKSALNNIEKNVDNMSPATVLKRGYSITLLNGKAVKAAAEVKEGSVLDTITFDGVITSIVKSSNKSDEI